MSINPFRDGKRWARDDPGLSPGGSFGSGAPSRLQSCGEKVIQGATLNSVEISRPRSADAGWGMSDIDLQTVGRKFQALASCSGLDP